MKRSFVAKESYDSLEYGEREISNLFCHVRAQERILSNIKGSKDTFLSNIRFRLLSKLLFLNFSMYFQL